MVIPTEEGTNGRVSSERSECVRVPLAAASSFAAVASKTIDTSRRSTVEAFFGDTIEKITLDDISVILCRSWPYDG